MKTREVITAAVLAAALLTPPTAYADEEIDDVEDTPIRAQKIADTAKDNSSGRADDWFGKSGDRGEADDDGLKDMTDAAKERLKRQKQAQDYDKKAAKKAEQKSYKNTVRERKRVEKEKEQDDKYNESQRERYVKLFRDDTYTYYLDKQNTHWTRVPYTADNQMIDVWVRLVEGDGRAELTQIDREDAAGKYTAKEYVYTPPAHYYLEHYYIWPDRKKIQFLCELEVTGRPENSIDERKYDYKNWEGLVPGSAEDQIYHTVIKYANRKGSFLGIKSGGKTARDMLEEYLRISL